MTFFLKQALGTTTVSCQSDNMLPYLEMSLKLYLVYMPLQAAIPQAHLCTRAKKRPLSIMRRRPDFIQALSDLGSDASRVDDSLFSVLQDLVCSMYRTLPAMCQMSTRFAARYSVRDTTLVYHRACYLQEPVA